MIEESLDSLNGSCIFSSIDFKVGYWQVELDRSKCRMLTTLIGTRQLMIVASITLSNEVLNSQHNDFVLVGLHAANAHYQMNNIRLLMHNKHFIAKRHKLKIIDFCI